jgi:anthranilate synthase component 1
VSIATGNQALSATQQTVSLRADVDLTGLMRLHPDRYPFLLQSSAQGPELARYDILFAFPGETLTLAADGSLLGPHASDDGFLAALDRWWASAPPAEQTVSELPFTGGWFLYLGYELANEVETSLDLNCDPALPVAFATRTPVAIIVDHHCGTAFIQAEEGYEHLLPDVLADIDNVGSVEASIVAPEHLVEESPDKFLAAVLRAQAYIRSGDIFQANLSRCWHAELPLAVDRISIYEQLCRANPAPFAGLILHDDFALLSSSPERLVQRRGERIDTRPIAGTRPRIEPPEQAAARKRELLDHPKERAEHIMLIDLERNDLGRVCEGGSVTVDEFMVVESYTHVHHIVSNVSGTARAGLTPGELIRAVFPGGTITGCPKVRCMGIIHELEQRPRGAYTGSMGYLNRNGDCDLNILIRSMLINGTRIELAAGSGIVADSDPQTELDETRAKAKGLLLALQDD